MKLFQKPEILLAVGLIFVFFMPWVNILFFSWSAYELAMQSDSLGDFGPQKLDLLMLKALWLVPVLAVNVPIEAYRGHDTKTLAQLAGLFPIIILGVAYFRVGKDLFDILTVGAYGAVAIGTALVLLGAGQVKSPAESSATTKSGADT